MYPRCGHLFIVSFAPCEAARCNIRHRRRVRAVIKPSGACVRVRVRAIADKYSSVRACLAEAPCRCLSSLKRHKSRVAHCAA